MPLPLPKFKKSLHEIAKEGDMDRLLARLKRGEDLDARDEIAVRMQAQP